MGSAGSSVAASPVDGWLGTGGKKFWRSGWLQFSKRILVPTSNPYDAFPSRRNTRMTRSQLTFIVWAATSDHRTWVEPVPSEAEIISHASLMHDVGKIGIPDHILFKTNGLNDTEWKIIQQHTFIGSRILEGSASKVMHADQIIAMPHHEKWDGSGIPNGLKCKEIPLWGRICCATDVYDALGY